MLVIKITENVGRAKYVVTYSFGDKRHKDGSEMFDIRIFSNKRKMRSFVDDLKSNGR